ncbi:hypothetical protein BpHYR1_003335 [Brachionus plicatilis]|uniref:Uncharacterized protein n=1 Tax=Brachionus plicatilis TaxID=10195 RepID=A0A3M7R941_BRAPC|nr:hypothetical protein BpHYR1_003335 [Brachionus plicatilis]
MKLLQRLNLGGKKFVSADTKIDRLMILFLFFVLKFTKPATTPPLVFRHLWINEKPLMFKLEELFFNIFIRIPRKIKNE